MDVRENLVNGFDGRTDRRRDRFGQADALVEGQWLASYDQDPRHVATHAEGRTSCLRGVGDGPGGEPTPDQV